MDEATPESPFERRWALSLLESVLARLRAEFAEAGKGDRFDSLSVFLDRDSGSIRYKELTESMASSAGAVRMLVHRMQRTYRRLLREEIAQSASSPE